MPSLLWRCAIWRPFAPRGHSVTLVIEIGTAVNKIELFEGELLLLELSTLLRCFFEIIRVKESSITMWWCHLVLEYLLDKI